MNNLILLLAIAAFFSTLIGGAVILRFKEKIHYFFAFAAGSLIAVSFLDILPESLKIAQDIGLPIRTIFLTVVISFFVYSLLERFFLTHPADEDPHGAHGHIMGPIGAGSLVLHSFLDGIAIGAAFQVNASVGLVVALAVLSHDFTDGINTVTLMLKNKHTARKAKMFLVLDAFAPVLGLLTTSLVFIPANVLAIMLAAFVGEFVYIGAATLLPETRHHDSKKIVTAMAVGILLIAVLTSLIAI
jgi:zinc transporter ZupT